MEIILTTTAGIFMIVGGAVIGLFVIIALDILFN